MSRRGNRLDNAPMEGFFASLEVEHVHLARYRTRAEAKAAVFEYVEVFHNRTRLHSGLGYRTHRAAIPRGDVAEGRQGRSAGQHGRDRHVDRRMTL